MDFGDLDELINGLEGAVEKGLDEAAEAAANVARAAAGGGALARSIRVLKRGPGRREIVTDAAGAAFVEQGRGPAVAHGKVMRFVVNGQPVFATRVGPAPPHPFMAPAAAELEARAAELVERALGRIVK